MTYTETHRTKSQGHQQLSRFDETAILKASRHGEGFEFRFGSPKSRLEKMVAFLTRGLGDGANWYQYEILDNDGLSIRVSHSSGEKWTKFLETFLKQCCRIANLDADVQAEGMSHVKLVLSEPDRIGTQ